MSTPIYYPHGIVLPGGLNPITQIEGLPLEFNFQEYSLRSASAVRPGLTGSHGWDPLVQQSTTQIADVLDACVLDNIAAGLTGNIDCEWRLATNLLGRIPLATAQHIRTRAQLALLTWESISAQNQQLANIDFRLQFIADGGNPALITENNVALQAPAAVRHAYTLGPATLTTSSVNETLCAQGVRFDNRNTFKTVYCNGTGDVEYSSIDTSDPMLTIDVEDVSRALALVNNRGEAITAFTWYLRKKELGGVNIPNATAEHIKFTATVGTAKPMNPRQIGVLVHNFAVDTAAAIV